MGGGVDRLSKEHQASDWVTCIFFFPPSRFHAVLIPHNRWLVRDKKRHFYLLQHSVLYWFNKEIDPAADFKKDVQGAIKLYLYQVKEQPTAGMSED